MKTVFAEGRGRHAEVALAVGMLVETLFLLFGWWNFGLSSPLFGMPTLWVSVAIVFLGTCLTGIVVGFLLFDKRHAAAYGFASALIPSLFFLFLVVAPAFVAGPRCSGYPCFRFLYSATPQPRWEGGGAHLSRPEHLPSPH